MHVRRRVCEIKLIERSEHVCPSPTACDQRLSPSRSTTTHLLAWPTRRALATLHRAIDSFAGGCQRAVRWRCGHLSPYMYACVRAPQNRSHTTRIPSTSIHSSASPPALPDAERRMPMAFCAAVAAPAAACRWRAACAYAPARIPCVPECIPRRSSLPTHVVLLNHSIGLTPGSPSVRRKLASRPSTRVQATIYSGSSLGAHRQLAARTGSRGRSPLSFFASARGKTRTQTRTWTRRATDGEDDEAGATNVNRRCDADAANHPLL